MPASVVVTCPVCKKQVQVSPDIVGKKVRCKGCSAVFTAKAPPAKAPAANAPAKAAPAKKGHDPEPEAYKLTHVDLAPRTFENCTVFLRPLQPLEHDDRGFRKFPRAIAGHRLLIGIDVMNAAEAGETWVLRADHAALDQRT